MTVRTRARILRAAAARLGLVVLGVAVVLLPLEVVLRIVAPVPEVANPLYSFHQSDPELGWVGRPRLRQRFVRPDFDALIEHSENGFRRPDPAPPAQASRQVLVLGDSFVWGWGVGQGEVFTDWLQRRLAPEVAVHNRGINGFATSQEYLLLQRELRDRHYDDVILLFVSNDFEDNVDGKSGRRPYFELVEGRLAPRNQPAERLMSPLKAFLKDHSLAFLWIDYRRNLLRHRRRARRTPAERQGEERRPPREAAELEGYAETERLLGAMQELATGHGARFHVILRPGKGEVDPRKRSEPLDEAVRDALVGICHRHGIDLLDLLPPLRAHAEQGGEPVYFPHDHHWTAAGHRLVAETILGSPIFSGRGAGREPIHPRAGAANVPPARGASRPRTPTFW